ncbi:MAG: protein-glutamate O-methyltransferase CheR [Candidatus Heimdallarchaeota archaeon]|nr:protein-glutamate O-methyltransferase CheR [Candidatus Heimdallarchaeota archaeon]
MDADDSKKSKVARGATLYTGRKKEKSDDTSKRKYTSKEKKEILSADMDFSSGYKAKDKENITKIVNFLVQAGLKVDSYKPTYLQRRIRSRISRLKLESFQEYYDYLRKSADEISILKENLSINVTRFFRNKDTYDYIENAAIPLILENQRDSNSRLNFWSAGCAVGAEPYSLAMIVSHPKFAKYKFQIHASDVKDELLELAKNATYDKGYFAEMDERVIRNNLDPVDSETYKIKPSVRNLVNFKKIDLNRDAYPTNLDMILCRNVLIYIEKEAQAKIIDKFHKSLNVGGLLVLGRTETLHGSKAKGFEVVDRIHRVYKKVLVI